MPVKISLGQYLDGRTVNEKSLTRHALGEVNHVHDLGWRMTKFRKEPGVT